MAKAYLRTQQKNDSTASWNTADAAGFKPLKGEIIVYNDVNRIKIGDGTNTVSNVPFLDDNCVHKDGVEEISGLKKFTNAPMIINNTINAWTSLDLFEDNTKAGIGWSDGEGNDGYVLIPQGQGETLAMCYDMPTKFSSFSVGTSLSGKTLYFNTTITYDDYYFEAVKTIVASSGGYSIKIGGPPAITLEKSGNTIATFYNYYTKKWNFDSYTLPSDFGTVTTFNDAHGAAVDSIFYTLGIAPILEYTPIDVKDVYLKTGSIPPVEDNLYSFEKANALSANQGRLLNVNKAPKDHASTEATYGLGTTTKFGHVLLTAGDLNGKTATDGRAASQAHIHSQYAPKDSPTFTGIVTLSGTTTPLHVSSSDGIAGQVLTSQGPNKSPIWEAAPTPSNMVTTDTDQIITAKKIIKRLDVGAPDTGDGGFYVSQGAESDGDTYFMVTTDGVDIDPDGHGIPLCVNSEPGSSGQILMSRGLNSSPLWTSDLTELNFKTSANSVKYNKLDSNGMYIYDSSGTYPLTTYYRNNKIVKTTSSNTYTLSLPSNTGTIALTSDIPTNHVTTDTAQTITAKKTFNSSVSLNCPVYLGASGAEGKAGEYLMSNGSTRSVYWTKIATSYIPSGVKATVSTNTNQTYNGASYSTTSTTLSPKYLSVLGYDNASTNPGSSARDILFISYTSSVSAGKWVKITGLPFTAVTATVTPRKSTTAGYGPRLITYISGTTVYVGIDDDDATGGFYLTLMA